MRIALSFVLVLVVVLVLDPLPPATPISPSRPSRRFPYRLSAIGYRLCEAL
jgi:hypothetical protein